MNVFFITGLPRTRTAWLANFLTHGQTFCFHEACRSLHSAGDLKTLFGSAGSPNVGTADSGFPAYYAQALEQFPQAKIVLIERDPCEAAASFGKLIQGFKRPSALKTACVGSTFAALATRLEEMQAALSGRYIPRVSFDKLGEEPTIRALWAYATGGEEFPAQRWAMLETMRINVCPEKVWKEIDLAALQRVFKPGVGAPAPCLPSNAITELHRQFFQLLQQMCGNIDGALIWMQQLWDVLATWDHIQDGDPIDKEKARRAFQAVLFYWPMNPFFQTHKEKLLPVMLNALSAWDYANKRPNNPLARVKAEDAFTEIPCAVAGIIGGIEHVRRYGDGIRTLANAIAEEDDRRGK